MSKFEKYCKLILGESYESSILDFIEIPEDLEDLIDIYSVYLDVYLNDDPTNKVTILRTLRAKKDAPKGTGTQFMEELCEWADANDRLLLLRTGVKEKPRKGDEYKATISELRLIKFYSRFGFVSNYSKKDYRPDLEGNMHRYPRK